LDEDNNKRKNIANFYLQNIKNENIILPSNKFDHVWHLFVVKTKLRDELQHYLNNHDIQTIIHYPIPPHKQKCYKDLNHLQLPVTENIHQEVLSLPISPTMKENDFKKVADILNKWKV
ncbi:TPA: DegT/DnrJ/EryC1/StrS family aminotransferase, partial [Campylobacter jejuni]|nr:DegT/DnrJ/EryC1/StrS family aminotransferase [Campylobacter jejuni]